MARPFLPFVLLIALWSNQVLAVTLSVDSLSRAEKSAIKKLRLLVKDSLPHEYMKEDLYLLRWLTMRNFNVDHTVTFLKKHIKWRQDNKMDQILREDWSELNKDFPYSMDTIDKQGRPVLYLRYGAWDISAPANSGNLKTLSRYFAKILEDADTKVRVIGMERKNVTQFDLIIDLNGYSLGKHGCYQCLTFYSEVGRTLQNHYPGIANKIVFINAPMMFSTTFGLLQTVLNDQTKESIKLVGEDRHLWEPVLLQFIDRGQFPKEIY